MPLLMRMERCLALARLAEHWASASNTGAECNVSSKAAQRQAVDWPESASVMAAVGVASSQSAQKAARGSSGLCVRHGGGTRCQHPNCTEAAKVKSKFCRSHGAVTLPAPVEPQNAFPLTGNNNQ